MKIIIAGGIFPPDPGGPATYTNVIAGELQKNGHHVEVVCFSDTTEDRNETFKVYRISRKLNRIVRYLKYLQVLKKISKGADLIYAQGPTSGGWQAMKVAKKYKIPYIVKMVGDYAWEQLRVNHDSLVTIEEFQTMPLKEMPPLVKRQRQMELDVSHNASLMVVPSQYLKWVVEQWKVPSEKIKVIYNAFAGKFVPEEIQRTPREPRLQCIARLVPWKGIEVALEAWQDVVKEIPGAHFTINGSGPSQSQFEQKAKDLGLEDSVTFTGRLDLADVLKETEKSRAFILNSQYEGLSHVLLEALSYAVIPIVSTNGGNPEVIEDNVNGFTFEYNNVDQVKEAMLKALKDDQTRVNMIPAMNQSLKKFDYDNMIKTTIETLTKVAQEHGK